MRGRKPKTRAEHKLDGTYRSDRHAGTIPNPGGAISMSPPPDLPEFAADFWRRHAPMLNRMGIGKAADEAALYQASMQWERLQKAYIEIRENGGETYICVKTGNPKRLPAGITAKDMEDRLFKWYSEVGLTPISRERLARERDENPEEAFILDG
jgi:P27 family predicted phage terminase small subunit